MSRRCDLVTPPSQSSRFVTALLASNNRVSAEHMSLALDYSSDDAGIVANDAFGVSSLLTIKKPRVDESVESNTAVIDSAPHVLAEVS